MTGLESPKYHVGVMILVTQLKNINPINGQGWKVPSIESGPLGVTEFHHNVKIGLDAASGNVIYVGLLTFLFGMNEAT